MHKNFPQLNGKKKKCDLTIEKIWLGVSTKKMHSYTQCVYDRVWASPASERCRAKPIWFMLSKRQYLCCLQGHEEKDTDMNVEQGKSTTKEKVQWCFKDLENNLPNNALPPLLNIYAKYLKQGSWIDTCLFMFIMYRQGMGGTEIFNANA